MMQPAIRDGFSKASEPVTARKENAANSKYGRAAVVAEKAVAHFEKHREQWVANRYRQLLMQDAPAPSLHPAGMKEDRTNRLLRAAAYMVDRNQSSRLTRIRLIGRQDRAAGFDMGR